RVPAIISWPGKIPYNEIRDQMAVNVDWFPTLLELCEINLPKHKIDGRSLTSIIKSREASSPHETFFWESGGGENPQWAVRHGDWKLLQNPVGNHLSESEKNPQNRYLFNIKNDLGEQENQVNQYPEIVKSLTEKYTEWKRNVYQQ